MTARDLIEAAIRKRDLIREAVRPYYESAGRVDEEVAGMLRPLPRASDPVEHSAEDGGHRVVDLEAYSIYMVRAWASCYRPGPGGYSPCGEESFADVGIVVPNVFESDRAALYREIAEAWVASRILDSMNGGVLLWDGSLRPILARRWPGAGGHGFRALLEIAAKRLGYSGWEDLLAGLEEEYSRGPMASQRIIESRLGLEELAGGDAEWVSVLEWAEKLVAFRGLLEKSWIAGVTIVFITKTSRSSSLLGRALPDVYYLRAAEPLEPFIAFSPDALYRGIRDIRGFPREAEVRGPIFPGGLEEFYSERLGLIQFYARMERGSPILGFEAALDLDALDPDGVEEAALRVASMILSLPMSNGYPLPLKMAHERGRIAGSDAERVLSVLGLSLERRGRSVLG